MSKINVREATLQDAPILFEMLRHKAQVEGRAGEFNLTAEKLDAMMRRKVVRSARTH